MTVPTLRFVHRLRFVSTRRLWRFALAVASSAVTTSLLSSAQTPYYTASRRVRLQEFGAVSFGAPSYNPANGAGTNFGATAGVNADFATRIWLNPGLELRATFTGGPVSDQFSYGGGPRLIAPLGRVQPYVGVLFGSGLIVFSNTTDPAYHRDTSNVYSFGGGADVRFKPGWAIKVDVESQRWRLSHNNDPFHPLLVSVGVRYEVHGGKRSPQQQAPAVGVH